MAIVFWVAIGAILYSYILYPLLLFVLVRVKRKNSRQHGSGAIPTVSVVVSCFNEETALAAKLRDLKRYAYSPDKIEFLFGSDGSTDRTNDILQKAEAQGAIRCFTFEQRRGKASVLNDLVNRARNDIVVFTDANTVFEPETISRLVTRFDDPTVGAVCGKLMLLNPGKEPGRQNEHSYWEFENWLKSLESDCHTLLGATGAVYAIRRNLYSLLPTNKPVTDDFIVPIRIVMLGYRVVYAQEARAFEESTPSITKEFKRKSRIGAQNYSGISDFRRLLAPSAGFVAFELWSHKIIRWFVPHLLLVALLATIILAYDSSLYRWILASELVVIGTALLGLAADYAGRRLGPLGLPYYTIAMNLALFVGFWRFVFKKQPSTWEVAR